MPKDFTDYVLTVYGAGERVYDDIHIRADKDLNEHPVKSMRLRDFKYLFAGYRDRAYRTKLSPWKKWDEIEKKPRYRIPDRYLSELLRSKKIGHLHYLEYCDKSTCKRCNDKRDCKAPEYIEPVHISKIHQPSGRFENEPIEMVEENGVMITSLLERNTPFTFKTVMDNKFYMQAYKSFKFGFKAALKSKWWIAVIIGVVAVMVVILVLTGNIPIGR